MQRIRKLNDREPRQSAQYVLYWSQMNRRAESNHALAFAADLANQRGLPLLFYEGLTCTYPFASDRFHTFLLDGIPETGRRLAKLGIGYVFYLRKRRDDPNDALYLLAADAAAVVTDDYPAFLAAQHNQSVPSRLDIPYYAVDSSCVVPMAHFVKQEYAAYTIRPKIQKVLAACLQPVPPIRMKKKWDLPVSPLHCEVTEANIPSLAAACAILRWPLSGPSAALASSNRPLTVNGSGLTNGADQAGVARTAQRINATPRRMSGLRSSRRTGRAARARSCST